MPAKSKAKGPSRATTTRKAADKSKSAATNKPKAAPKPARKPRALTTAAAKAKITRKPGAKAKAVAKAKANVGASAAKSSQARKTKKVVLLSGGNPQIAKGEGDAPVQAYIAAMPGWKRELGERLDALIVRAVPKVRKAVKWNSPFYGVEGQGWFLGVHVYTHYIKVAFFRGAALRPPPPGPSKDKNVRYMDLREGELDVPQMTTWVKQAAALPGWIPGRGS